MPTPKKNDEARAAFFFFITMFWHQSQYDSRLKLNFIEYQRYTPITVDQTAPFETRKI